MSVEAGRGLVLEWVREWADAPPLFNLRAATSDKTLRLLGRYEVALRFQEIHELHGEAATASASLSTGIYHLEKALRPASRAEDRAAAHAWLELLVVLGVWPCHAEGAW